MINREIIRIKIVQLTYAYYQNGNKNIDSAEKYSVPSARVQPNHHRNLYSTVLLSSLQKIFSSTSL